jgi:hypothetical protein
MSKVIIALLILLFPIIALLLFYIIFFTPLEGPAACSGNEDKILFWSEHGV